MAAQKSPLLWSLQTAKAALATKPYLPILTHFLIDGERVLACSGTLAIEVDGATSNLRCCVPGELLLKTLNSVADQTVEMAVTNNVLQIKSGRTKVKIPVMPVEDYPFVMPPTDGWNLFIDEQFIAGVQQCQSSMGADGNHLEMVGITVHHKNGEITLYATNNVTLSRYRTKATRKSTVDTMFLPSDFCNLLVAVHKQTPKVPMVLWANEHEVMAEVGAVFLYGKLPVGLPSVDFEKVIGRHMDGGLVTYPIPAELLPALERSLSLLASEQIKTVELAGDNNRMLLEAKCKAGTVEDDVPYSDYEFDPVKVDPALLYRGAKLCTHMALTKRAVVLTKGEQFLQLIAVF